VNNWLLRMSFLSTAVLSLPVEDRAGGEEQQEAWLGALDELGEDGWLKALELDEYAARSQNGPESIQGVLFSYLEAL
jgi:hypothetical protein